MKAQLRIDVQGRGTVETFSGRVVSRGQWHSAHAGVLRPPHALGQVLTPQLFGVGPQEVIEPEVKSFEVDGNRIMTRIDLCHSRLVRHEEGDSWIV